MADGGVMYCLEIMECMLEGLSITFFHCCLSSASTIRMYVLCRMVGLLLEENQTFIPKYYRIYSIIYLPKLSYIFFTTLQDLSHSSLENFLFFGNINETFEKSLFHDLLHILLP